MVMLGALAACGAPPFYPRRVVVETGGSDVPCPDPEPGLPISLVVRNDAEVDLEHWAMDSACREIRMSTQGPGEEVEYDAAVGEVYVVRALEGGALFGAILLDEPRDTVWVVR